MSQDSSWSISFPRSIVASLTVVYSSGAGVVPKGDLRHIKAILPTIAMHVDMVVAFTCIWRYNASGSVFPIRIRFVGHLLRIAEIMCRILSRQKP